VYRPVNPVSFGIARLADILGIDEFAPKSVFLVHCPRDAFVCFDVDLTVQAAECTLSLLPSAGAKVGRFVHKHTINSSPGRYQLILIQRWRNSHPSRSPSL